MGTYLGGGVGAVGLALGLGWGADPNWIGLLTLCLVLGLRFQSATSRVLLVAVLSMAAWVGSPPPGPSPDPLAVHLKFLRSLKTIHVPPVLYSEQIRLLISQEEFTRRGGRIWISHYEGELSEKEWQSLDGITTCKKILSKTLFLKCLDLGPRSVEAFLFLHGGSWVLLDGASARRLMEWRKTDWRKLSLLAS